MVSLMVQWIRTCLPMQRGHGFNPWSKKIPHVSEQLSPSATTTEPQLLCIPEPPSTVLAAGPVGKSEEVFLTLI